MGWGWEYKRPYEDRRGTVEPRMCKLELAPLQKEEAKPPTESHQIQEHEMTEEEKTLFRLEMRRRRKKLLLENSILRRLGPNAKLNLNLHWAYLERVMVKKENLPPLYQPNK